MLHEQIRPSIPLGMIANELERAYACDSSLTIRVVRERKMYLVSVMANSCKEVRFFRETTLLPALVAGLQFALTINPDYAKTMNTLPDNYNKRR